MKKISDKNKRICLIGVGKVGSALYHSLNKADYNFVYAVDEKISKLKIITADNDNIKIDDKIKKEYLVKSDVIIFAVQEKSLKRIINYCGKFNLNLTDKIIFHLSGIETSEIIKSLKINAAKIGSFHPLQTFNKISYEKNKLLNNIYFGIEGGVIAVKYLSGICKVLKSKYIIVPKDKKILYHGACVIASNFLVSHFNIIAKITKELKLNNKESIEIFKPIIYTTLENIFKNGTAESLTGPFERGDIKTIELHLKELKDKLPSVLYYYILLGVEAMNLSKDKNSISKKESMEIEKIFLNHI